MKKDKFVQDAKSNPGRYYRNPFDVIRDRRLTNGDRLAILEAWEREARQQKPQDDDEASKERLEQLQRLREDLEGVSDQTSDPQAET